MEEGTTVNVKRWLMRDSRGKYSFTHTLAIPIVIAVTLKMLISGTSLSYQGMSLTLSNVTALDYVEIVKYWIGLYAVRETTEKVVDCVNAVRDRNTSDTSGAAPR